MASSAAGVGKPDAKDAERRKHRQDIRNHFQSVQRNKEVLCDITNNRLNDEIKRLETLMDKVTDLKAKEASADADTFKQLVECGVEASKKLLQQQQGRGPLDLVNALRSLFVHTSDPQGDAVHNPRAFCWGELGGFGRHLFRPAPGAHCLLGPLDARPKEAKARQQRTARKHMEVLTRPDEGANIDEEANKQETDRNMMKMWEVLLACDKELIPIPHLVLHHTSFARTVENMFTLSFLVKENRVALRRDAAHGLCVQVLGKGAAGGKADKGDKVPPGCKPQQLIMTLHMTHWNLMRAAVAPGDCMMPQEAPGGAAGQAGGGGSAGKRGAQQAGAGSGPSNKKQRPQ